MSSTPFLDLDAMRLRPSDDPPQGRNKKARKGQAALDGEFFTPLPLQWGLRLIQVRSYQARDVAMILWRERRMREARGEGSAVNLSNERCERYGVSRKTKDTGLRHLVAARLVKVAKKKSPKASPRVTILEGRKKG
jgi:hypothetical protein